MFFFRKRKKQPSPTEERWPLDQVIGWLGPSDPWRLRDAVCGTMVLGESGSGKTSGAGCFLLQNLLKSGMGGALLTVKFSDILDIQRYAAECGRLDDLIIFEPNGPHRCNLLEYELTNGGEHAAMRLENAVQFFDTAMEIAERGKGASGGGDNQFFQRAAKGLVRAATLPLLLARRPVTPDSICQMVSSAPLSPEEARDTKWRGRSFCYETLCAADDLPMDANTTQDFEHSLRYLMEHWPAMDTRTRSNIFSTFMTVADTFRHGQIRHLFFSETTITPEACRHGKILVIALPTLTWNESGRAPQALFKYCWQRAQERCSEELKQAPVFLFCDEATQFFTRTDAAFQATARSSRVCTVYLAQNLAVMYDSVGGEAGRHSIDGLLGNLRLKLLFAQNEASTCQFQSELIGKTRRLLFNSNLQGATTEQFDFFNPRRNHSTGMSESWEYEVQPWEWSRGFRRGGPQDGFVVDAIAYQGGATWAGSGRPYLSVAFQQR